MTEPITVTPTQDAYLQELAAAPQTTRDLALLWTVSTQTASRVIKKLRELGLVQSTKVPLVHGNTWQHELITPYSELNVIIRRNSTGITIPDAEIHYAAKLRNAGLVGRRLTEAHLRKYPDRPEVSVRLVVTTAKARGLCR